MSTGAFAYGTIAAAGSQSTPAEPASWPLNGWAMYGGYQISAQDRQFEDDPNGLPALTWNLEKDILIIQGLGWTQSIRMDEAAERFKIFKDNNPNGKLLYYFLPVELTKTDPGSGATGYVQENYRLVNSATRGDPDWYMTDINGNKVESQFNPTTLHRANGLANQFSTTNSFGRTHIEQFFFEHLDTFTTVRSNGERLIDLVDGLYWDALDSNLELVYLDGSNGATQVAPDLNKDGTGESRNDETIPTPTSNEDGYGGARMQRRGAIEGLNYYRSIFPSDKVMFRNGTKDGILYQAQNLSDAPDTNEFYQQFDGTIAENFQNDLGLRASAQEGYDVDFDNFESGIERLLRIKEFNKPEGSHPWGSFGFHCVPMVVNTKDRTTEAGITSLDYAFARFYAGISALCGTCFAPYMNTQEPFPRPDEYIFDWGDPVDGASHPTIGTVDMSSQYGPVTLRSYDYTTGGAKFYWVEFENCLWVVRGDPPPIGDLNYGTGAAATCELPDPGTGKKWQYFDTTSPYTNPNTGWQTRNQDPSVNSGGDVLSVGTYGGISLLPWHAQMLVRVDEGAPGGGTEDITVLDSWAFVDDDDPNSRSFTVSAGTDRVLVLAYAAVHDISAFGWSTPTVTYGGQSPTATYKFGGASGVEGANEDDTPRYFAIWNDAALQAATSSTFSWTGSIITNEFYGCGSYENVSQTGLDSLVNDATDNATDNNGGTLTTTSSSGDRILAIGCTAAGTRTHQSWDTLTELHDVAASSGNARYGFAEGNGGDSSTFIQNQQFSRANWASIVLPKA